MDPYKQLALEYPLISSTIKGYTTSGASQILPKLGEAIKAKDRDAILYCLNVIIEWYDRNIYSIRANQFVYNKDDHSRIQGLVKKLKEEIEIADLSIFESTKTESTKMNTADDKRPLIFLSHRSSDRKYGDALRDFLIGLGVKNDQLIYTSHPLHKIPLDENIYDYLRESISRNVFMIILWSNEYLDSPACMNELGAAWVVKCDYTNIYVPDFSFGNPKYHECAVDTKKMGAVLRGDAHCKQNMIELKNKIVELFGLEVDEQKLTFLLDTFIDSIKGAAANG